MSLAHIKRLSLALIEIAGATLFHHHLADRGIVCVCYVEIAAIGRDAVWEAEHRSGTRAIGATINTRRARQRAHYAAWSWRGFRRLRTGKKAYRNGQHNQVHCAASDNSLHSTALYKRTPFLSRESCSIATYIL